MFCIETDGQEIFPIGLTHCVVWKNFIKHRRMIEKVVKKFLFLMQLVALTGCSGTIHETGSIHDSKFSGDSKRIVILNAMSTDAGSNQGTLIAHALHENLKTCHIDTFNFSTNKMSLDMGSEITKFVSENHADKVLILSNRNVVLFQGPYLSSQVIKARILDVATNKSVWVSEFNYNASKWHFGDVWQKNDVKSADAIADKIKAGLVSDNIIKGC